MKNEIPRRIRMDLMTPAELAITHAIGEVEKAGADVKLTEAVITLSKARDLVADFIDSTLPVEIIIENWGVSSEFCPKCFPTWGNRLIGKNENIDTPYKCNLCGHEFTIRNAGIEALK